MNSQILIFVISLGVLSKVTRAFGIMNKVRPRNRGVKGKEPAIFTNSMIEIESSVINGKGKEPTISNNSKIEIIKCSDHRLLLRPSSSSSGNNNIICMDERSKSILTSLCGICMDMKSEEEMFSSNNIACAHSYCLVCISSHVAAKIEQNIIKVKCPDLGCNSLLEPQNCMSFVPRQVLDRWEAALCEAFLGSNKIIYCPFKGCSAPLMVEHEDVIRLAECPHCHRLFCAQCLVPWHAGSECKKTNTMRIAKEKMADMKFMDLAKRQQWQKCPKCSFYLERILGCESIMCRYDQYFVMDMCLFAANLVA